jgi:hypothetical protein
MAASAAAVVALSACDDGAQTARAVAQWRERQARIDPPQLWSVQAVHEAHGGKAVLICADSELRSGFTSVIPAFGKVHCARETDTKVEAAPSPNYRCMLGGAEYAVATSVKGDRGRDFEADSTILRDGQTVYARILRFRRVGACPAGWECRGHHQPEGSASQQRRRAAIVRSPPRSCENFLTCELGYGVWR